MARFQGKGSTTQVDLAVALYNNAVARNDKGEITAAFPTVYKHPQGEGSKGQTNLALNTRRDDKSPSGYNNTTAYAASQMQDIVATAGENYAPLLNKDKQEVGRIYGVKADVMRASDKSGMVINTKTLNPSELSVGPDANGRDLIQQVIDTHKEAKAMKEAEGPAVAQEQQQAQTETSKSAAPFEPEMG